MANKQIRGLKRSSEFAFLKTSGKKFRPSDWMLISFARNKEGLLRYGVTIPRQVGNAVIRNRLRRWCREFFRSRKSEVSVPEVDINVVFRPQPKDFFKELKHKDFDASLERAWTHLEARCKTG